LPSLPDITPAQLVSTVLAVVGLFVTQGLVTNNTGKVVGGLASILVPVAWQLGDAIIRHGRSRAIAAVSSVPPDQGDAGPPKASKAKSKASRG
jgi:predicted histidine transporter YuiF (NhaC family)